MCSYLMSETGWRNFGVTRLANMVNVDSQNAGVLVERHEHVAYIKIDRPEKRNALTQAMWAAIAPMIDQLNSDLSIRLIVVGSSSPGVFSAGADIGEYRHHVGDLEWGADSQRVVGAALAAVAQAHAPTLAAIDGPCFGGGAGIAVACDFRIATRSATFAITPAKLGMVYEFGALVALVDLVGPAQAKKILFTGETFDATQAERMGFVDSVVGDSDLEAATEAFAAGLVKTSGMSARIMKEAIQRIMSGHREECAETDEFVNRALRSADYHEGVSAFIERRPPVFES